MTELPTKGLTVTARQINSFNLVIVSGDWPCYQREGENPLSIKFQSKFALGLCTCPRFFNVWVGFGAGVNSVFKVRADNFFIHENVTEESLNPPTFYSPGN